MAASDDGAKKIAYSNAYGDERTVWHAGTMPGFSAPLRAVPDRRLAVVLANHASRLDRIAEAALGLALTPELPAEEGRPVEGEEAARLVGRYTNRRTFELSARGERLGLQRFGEWLPVVALGGGWYAAQADDGHAERFVLLDGAEGQPNLLLRGLWAFAREPGAP